MGQDISNSISHNETSDLLSQRKEHSNNESKEVVFKRGEIEKTEVILRNPSDHSTSKASIVSENTGIFVISKNRKRKIPLSITKRVKINFESLQLKVDFFRNRDRGFDNMLFQFFSKEDLERFGREITQSISNHEEYIKFERFRVNLSKSYVSICDSLRIPTEPFLTGTLEDVFLERSSKLNLRNFPLHVRNYSPLFRSIRWNYGISEIDLSRTGVTDKMLSSFCRNMKYNTSLRKLLMNGFHLKSISITREGAYSLSKLLSSKSCRIEFLSLKFSKIGDEGATLIFKSLANNRYIRSIDLSHNNLENDVTEGVTTALESNECFLEDLNMEGNNLGYYFVNKVKNTIERRKYEKGLSVRLSENPCFKNEDRVFGYLRINKEKSKSNENNNFIIPFEDIRFSEDDHDNIIRKRSEITVFKAELNCGVDVRIQQIDVSNNLSIASHLKTEAHYIQTKLSHPNLLNLYGISFHHKFAYIISESPQTNLRRYFQDPDVILSFSMKWKMMTQIVHVLEYLKTKNVPYVSISPSNIFIHPSLGQIRVSDYGFLGTMGNSLFSPMDSFYEKKFEEENLCFFVAPEIYRNRRHKKRKFMEGQIVYSLGMILYEMLTHKPPFCDMEIKSVREREELMVKVEDDESFRPEFIGSEDEKSEHVLKLEELIVLCWSKKVEDRPSLNFIIEFFENNYN